jgi:hypothetical protein
MLRKIKSATPKGQTSETYIVVYLHNSYVPYVYVPLDGKVSFPHIKIARPSVDADRSDVFQSGSSPIPPLPYRQAASFPKVVQGTLSNQQSELRELTLNDSLVKVVTGGECEMNILRHHCK